MNRRKSSSTRVRIALLLTAVLIFTMIGNPWISAYAQDIPTDTSASGPDVPPTTTIEVISPYFSIEHRTMSDGMQIEGYIINGPPNPPAEYEAERAASILPLPSRGVIASFPSYDWVFGCSAVSGAMIAAYYDNNGYTNMYAGPTNGGVMPLTDTSWSTWSDGIDTYPNNPLIASHNGVDGRVTKGSIDDYWVEYGSSAYDPYITGAWTQHAWSNAIGDYMKTSQSAAPYLNSDGSTSFYNHNDSNVKLTCADMVYFNVANLDGTYGRKLFYEARGYTVTDCYNQNTDNNVTGGFTLANFQAEIDAGRPVLLNLAGHSIVGYGYSGSTIYIRDTWSSNTAYTPTVIWGGSYDGMQLLSVSVVHLEDPNLHMSYLPFVVNGMNALPQSLWSQGVSVTNTDAYANQDFESTNDPYDIYIADDFLVSGSGWEIKKIFVPGIVWNGGTTLLDADHLVFQIYTNNAGKPSGYPGGGSPLWSFSLLPTDGQITLSTGVDGFLSNVTLELSSPVYLAPGSYWLVFYPQLDIGVGGQYGRHVSDTTNGYDAMVINPGAAFGLPIVWTSIQDSSTWGMAQQDMAFEIWGYK